MDKGEHLTLVRNTLRYPERLRNADIIDKIFKREGHRLKSYPLSLFYLECPLPYQVPAQMMVVVPRKNLRHQVHRAQVKRALREHYRLNKHIFFEAIGTKQFALVWHYADKTPVQFHDLEIPFKKILDEFVARIK